MQHNMSEPSKEDIRAASDPTSIHLSSHNSIREVFIWPTSSVIHKMQKMQGISSKLGSIKANIPNSVTYRAFSFISQTMDNIVSQLQMFNILTPDGHYPEGKHSSPNFLSEKIKCNVDHWDKCCNFCCDFVEKQRLFCMPFFLMGSYMELKTVSVTQSQMLCCRSILLFIPFTQLRISYTQLRWHPQLT
jgi:hypothetical protein